MSDRIDMAKVLAGSREGLFGITVRNLCANYSILTSWQNKMSLSFRRNEEKGRPALVFASGPSLDYGMETLKQKLTDDFVLIAGPTQLWNLEANGISPDYVVSVDPRPETGWFFNNKKIRKYKVISHPHAAPGTFKYVDPAKLRMFLPKVESPGHQQDVANMRMQDFLDTFKIGADENVGRYLKEPWLVLVNEVTEAAYGSVNHHLKHPIEIRMFAGGSSPVQAMIAAYVLGCDPIYYIGLDLCYWRGRQRSRTLLPSGKPYQGYEKREAAGAAPKEILSSCAWPTTEEMVFYKFAALQCSHMEGMEFPVRVAEIVVDGEPGNLQCLPRVRLEDLSAATPDVFVPIEQQRERVYEWVRSIGIKIKEMGDEEKSGTVHLRPVSRLPGADSDGSLGPNT